MNEPTLLGHGHYWQDLSPSQEFITFGRTITETDLMNFISLTGMTEVIFTDQRHKGAMEGRVIPGALTYTLIEGLQVQGMLQGTGMALLEIHQTLLAPVRVQDTIYAHVRIDAIRPTSRHGRAVVSSTTTILNQDDIPVMRYAAKRLMAGKPDSTTR